jgi:SAM-dependent methyltransferase
MGNFENYFNHLQNISLPGRLYKRIFSSPILFSYARRFGPSIIEVGSGIGSGLLGSFPNCVSGLDINPIAVDYCKKKGLHSELINDNGSFPISDEMYDSCVLDNVLEHIADPKKTLNECYRITGEKGGLVIAVPGVKGFNSDPDHKFFYDENGLRLLDDRWLMINLFSMPFPFVSMKLSNHIRQYCLVAVYKKKSSQP